MGGTGIKLSSINSPLATSDIGRVVGSTIWSCAKSVALETTNTIVAPIRILMLLEYIFFIRFIKFNFWFLLRSVLQISRAAFIDERMKPKWNSALIPTSIHIKNHFAIYLAISGFYIKCIIILRIPIRVVCRMVNYYHVTVSRLRCFKHILHSLKPNRNKTTPSSLKHEFPWNMHSGFERLWTSYRNN